QMNIQELHQAMIAQLNSLFQAHKGEHPISFEVMEIERVKKKAEALIKSVEAPAVEGDDTLEDSEAFVDELPADTEELRVVTHLAMPSRKVKIKISRDLLSELEKMQLNFKLN
ncbi:hypothetical protein, partial [Flavobacterium sp.]|uniref:hypothetical protein n=1 Tax=Flavobacterium sp. TaxID=239 RepID=UPI00391DC2CE